ncbi:hypothetical protein LOCC1_G008308 [Lachnellula occidentalis]|uniref:Uncharacterized protein n=1 Tax=Lachnellula occidentalis TaxID=215460 RepID=A0A8H8RQ25_9HELO|nr:hypothetical protein LOCC1_G008308 [Lachnellula occidentalis]
MPFPLTPSSIIFGLQGGLGMLNGFANLLIPALVVKNSKVLNIASIPALHTIALGAITYGEISALYVNAAYKADTQIMWWSIVGRGLAVVTFGLHGGVWGNIALFEGAMSVLTAGNLLWEWRTESTYVKGV